MLTSCTGYTAGTDNWYHATETQNSFTCNKMSEIPPKKPYVFVHECIRANVFNDGM